MIGLHTSKNLGLINRLNKCIFYLIFRAKYYLKSVIFTYINHDVENLFSKH